MLLDVYLQRHPVVGEDTYELFKLIEQSFDVTLGNYADIAGTTVQQLAHTILLQHPPSSGANCLSSAVFYRLRRSFMDMGIQRDAVLPSTKLASLLPWKGRRDAWETLGEKLQIEIPSLTFPTLIVRGSLLVPLILLIEFHRSISWFLMPVAWVVTLYLLQPLARRFRPGCETISGLVHSVSALNYSVLAKKAGWAQEAEVAELLRCLIVDRTELPLEAVTQTTRIPQDLNIY